jgi:5-methylcytosine-specific restriction endonuclease McrA
MTRKSNTDINGKPFAKTKVGEVWRKGKKYQNKNIDVWRKDAFGNPIKNSAYGNTRSNFGWEVDHVRPVAKGGTDAISNLQPLQWKANRQKSDTYR